MLVYAFEKKKKQIRILNRFDWKKKFNETHPFHIENKSTHLLTIFFFLNEVQLKCIFKCEMSQQRQKNSKKKRVLTTLFPGEHFLLLLLWFAYVFFVLFVRLWYFFFFAVVFHLISQFIRRFGRKAVLFATIEFIHREYVFTT